MKKIPEMDVQLSKMKLTTWNSDPVWGQKVKDMEAQYCAIDSLPMCPGNHDKTWQTEKRNSLPSAVSTSNY